MLTGKVNENIKKNNNNRSNQLKSNLAGAVRLFCTFLCRCFARPQHETSRNFLVYTLYGGNVGRVLVHFFFTVAHFHPGGRYKISFCSSNKNVSFCFFSLTLAPFHVELLWPVAYFLVFSVFLFLYIRNYFRQHGYRNICRFPFSSLLTLQLSLLHETRVAIRFPASDIWYIGLHVVGVQTVVRAYATS